MICIGLNNIHRHGYVHRDVKSENILIKEFENGFKIPLIGDFGLARHNELKITDRTLNDACSYKYAAPE
jgi:serine/threonine protein kinase